MIVDVIGSDAEIEALKAFDLSLDFRTHTFPERSSSPTGGLVFEPGTLATQSFVVKSKGDPSAVLTVVVEPADYLAEQRYFVSTTNGTVVGDVKMLLGERPDFAVVAGWAMVRPGHETSLCAVPGSPLAPSAVGGGRRSSGKCVVHGVGHGSLAVRTKERVE